MSLLRIGLLVLGMVLASLGRPALAADPARAILVLDASGSMLAKVGGKPKIAVAREVVAGLLKDWDPAVQLGVIAYGHRSKGDCDDIQTLVPVGPVDAQAINAALADLKPKGKTPLSRAVRLAGEQLAYTEEPATVILVSDGKETCDPDPCAVAGELKAKGVDFKLHVVGFNVTPEEKAQLQCMAEATGGLFLSAANADELSKALARTVELVAQPAPPPPPKPAGEPGLKVRTLAADGAAPLKQGLVYQVAKAEADLEGKHEQVEVSYDAEPSFKLPPGRYLVAVKYGGNESNAEAQSEVEVTAAPAELTLVLGAGAAKLATLPVAGAKPLKDQVTYEVYEAEADLDGTRRQAAVSYDAEPIFKLKAGPYHVEAKWGANESNATAATDIQVEPGKTTQATLVLDAGLLRVKTIASPDSPALSGGLVYNVHEAASELEDSGPPAAVSYDAQPAFRLKAGKYRVMVEQTNGGKASADVEIQAGKPTDAVLDLSGED